MIKTIRVSNVENTASRLAVEPSQKNIKTVKSIICDVQKNGDSAILHYERKFGSSISSLKVTPHEIEQAFSTISKEQLDAIKLAKTRLKTAESAIKSLLRDITTFHGGVRLSKKFVPLESVGCYVPGGLARYPSSAVMSVVPAKVARVKRIVVVSPPNHDGKIDPLTIVSANMCGATEIYKTGGAQAIAALSFGTKSIKKVDKIVGPGGEFVTLAKEAIRNNTAIDMLAGPTELGILADDSANPHHIALDLISQSEHSQDTRCFLITDSDILAKSVKDELNSIIHTIKRRDIVQSSLKNNGFIAVCKSIREAIRLADALAPEHLQIITKRAQSVASQISSAGLLLVGKYSPSAASDYLFGSNHILPTCGSGKSRGSLSVLDFVKVKAQASTTKSTLYHISKYMKVITDAEGLPNHYEAVRGRLG